LPLWAILRLIYYNIPTNVSLSLPFSVLVGALMAVSHLGASNQMLALRTCSVRRASILTPLLMCSFLAAIGSFIFSDYYLPLGRINTQKIILQLLSNNPKVIINPYSVRSFRNDNGNNTYIISGPVRNDIINELIIVDYDQDLNRRVFFAQRARLAEDRPSGVIPFVLDEVKTIVASNLEPQKYSYMSATSLLYNVLLGDVTETYRLVPDDRQSWEIIRTLRETMQEEQESQERYQARTAEYRMHYRSSYKGFYMTTDDTLTKTRLQVARDSVVNRPRSFYDDKMFTYKMALYLRLSIPFSCIPFMILAFTLGSMAKRYGRTIGFLLGLILSGIFWFSLAGGRLLGRSSNLEIPPFFLMFASNIVFLILGALLLLRQRN
ncbi:MAG: LptF/LptG family permease, partial [Spirochaetota bacterium]